MHGTEREEKECYIRRQSRVTGVKKSLEHYAIVANVTRRRPVQREGQGPAGKQFSNS